MRGYNKSTRAQGLCKSQCLGLLLVYAGQPNACHPCSLHKAVVREFPCVGDDLSKYKANHKSVGCPWRLGVGLLAKSQWTITAAANYYVDLNPYNQLMIDSASFTIVKREELIYVQTSMTLYPSGAVCPASSGLYGVKKE